MRKLIPTSLCPDLPLCDRGVRALARTRPEGAGPPSLPRVALAGSWAGLRRKLGLPDRERLDFEGLWDALLPRLERALGQHDRGGRRRPFAAPARSAPGTPGPGAADAVLDQAAALLAGGGGLGHRERVRELERTTRWYRARLAECRQQRISAPERSLWRRTASRYEAEGRALERRIQAAENALAEEREGFARELRELGLTLDGPALEVLLTTVVGDDLVGMALAFDNVRQITGQLERLVGESHEDIEAARRYYGMYSLLLRALDRLHGQMIEALDTRYVRAIEAIAERTLELMRETRALKRRLGEHATTLAANLEAQQLTVRAATAYRSYLLDQRRQLVGARERLAHDIAVATNTYETVKVSGELVGMMASARRLVETLRQVQVQPPRAFENLAMRREVERLTLRLRGSG